MSEATPRRCAGVLAAACTQGKRTKHGKPQSVVSDDQPEAREGQAGSPGVAERFVLPLKPGNAGGGKGPQFKRRAMKSGARWSMQASNRSSSVTYLHLSVTPAMPTAWAPLIRSICPTTD